VVSVSSPRERGHRALHASRVDDDVDCVQHMSMSGLTRDNVASHLQKHRMHVKKCKESSSTLPGATPSQGHSAAQEQVTTASGTAPRPAQRSITVRSCPRLGIVPEQCSAVSGVHAMRQVVLAANVTRHEHEAFSCRIVTRRQASVPEQQLQPMQEQQQLMRKPAESVPRALQAPRRISHPTPVHVRPRSLWPCARV
jgi:hypothetical protein